MTHAKTDPRLFDEKYFQHGCGEPYQRTTIWLNFFDGIAEHIVHQIAPRSALDAGCAMGFLVEGLRKRNVDAWGIDVAQYAIERVHPSIRDYCALGSVTEPLNRRYDLIVSIEVLEHMSAPESEQAIKNFCQATDDILFSSTPSDFTAPTHFNVQPIEYWERLFAAEGFYRDKDFDASFITPWAMRLRKASQDKPARDSATSILVISHDVVGRQMAGPGIRYYHLARELSKKFSVILAVPHQIPSDLAHNNFSLIEYSSNDLTTLRTPLATAKAIVLPGILAKNISESLETDAAIVIDGYDPYLAEWLAANRTSPSNYQSDWSNFFNHLTPQFLLGDFFICASERQRDWWLGLLEASGRINPYTFRQDASLRKLIDVVPYGLPENPPRATRKMVKGVWSGIADDDQVILWGGGLWPWLDPLTAIRAFAQVHQQQPRTRLIFPGTQHPNPTMKEMPTHNIAARALVHDLGLESAIFFGEWVPYEDWQNVLLESDVALTLHGEETLESRLAFRSRVFDYLWAGLPVIATRGDATSDLIAQNDLGIVVESRDVDGVANAMARLLDAPGEYRARIDQVCPQLTWDCAAAPLVKFCESPQRAPDKIALGEHLGNPFYTAQMRQTQEENVRLKNLVDEYSHRRSVRWANQLSRYKGR